MNISLLIDKISPLYNKYKQNKENLSGIEALEIMWDIGEILKKCIEKNNIAPHNLYRKVYGKSEGKNFITQKSYITREFQGRCYRIRNIFKSKIDIKNNLPTLVSFNAFRESMPFFDNEKYKLTNSENKALLKLLNSKNPSNDILVKVRILLKNKINKFNPRTQKLHELENEKIIFINFYNYIYRLVKGESIIQNNEIIEISKDIIRTLAKNTNSLTQDGLKFYDLEFNENMKSPWKEYISVINMLKEDVNPKTRRRFRRLIPPERIAKLSEMLYTMIK